MKSLAEGISYKDKSGRKFMPIEVFRSVREERDLLRRRMDHISQVAQERMDDNDDHISAVWVRDRCKEILKICHEEN